MSPSHSAVGGGTTGSHDDSWQETADSTPIEEADLQAIYLAALGESKFDSAELEDVHTLVEKAQVTLDPRSPMVRTVLRDMKQLQEAELIHADSAVFVRQVGVSGTRGTRKTKKGTLVPCREVVL